MRQSSPIDISNFVRHSFNDEQFYYVNIETMGATDRPNGRAVFHSQCIPANLYLIEERLDGHRVVIASGTSNQPSQKGLLCGHLAPNSAQERFLVGWGGGQASPAIISDLPFK